LRVSANGSSSSTGVGGYKKIYREKRNERGKKEMKIEKRNLNIMPHQSLFEVAPLEYDYQVVHEE
jgi:hypothetical protein